MDRTKKTKTLSRIYLLVVISLLMTLPLQVLASDTVTMEPVDLPSSGSAPAASQSNTAPSEQQAQPPAAQVQPWFFGGTIGLGLGDVEYYELSPMIGRNLNPKTTLGVSFMYRYRKDKRYEPDYSTNDYGATLFGRFNLTPKFYLQAEYEYLDYEYASIDGRGNVIETLQDDFTSFLAGAGLRSPLGKNASMYITAMYNFNYDDANSPYTDPISIRVGVGVGY
ncbi:MAG: hypothetical protein ACC707_03945 [Thiohalomonadales bacterium]